MPLRAMWSGRVLTVEGPLLYLLLTNTSLSFLRPQLVFDWSLPPSGSRASSDENSDANGIDVPHVSSDDESENGGDYEGDSEVTKMQRPEQHCSHCAVRPLTKLKKKAYLVSTKTQTWPLNLQLQRSKVK